YWRFLAATLLRRDGMTVVLPRPSPARRFTLHGCRREEVGDLAFDLFTLTLELGEPLDALVKTECFHDLLSSFLSVMFGSFFFPRPTRNSSDSCTTFSDEALAMILFSRSSISNCIAHGFAGAM